MPKRNTAGTSSSTKQPGWWHTPPCRAARECTEWRPKGFRKSRYCSAQTLTAHPQEWLYRWWRTTAQRSHQEVGRENSRPASVDSAVTTAAKAKQHAQTTSSSDARCPKGREVNGPLQRRSPWRCLAAQPPSKTSPPFWNTYATHSGERATSRTIAHVVAPRSQAIFLFYRCAPAGRPSSDQVPPNTCPAPRRPRAAVYLTWGSNALLQNSRYNREQSMH